MSKQKDEDKEQKQKLAICFSKWERQDENDIISRIDLFIGDQTVASNIATNTASCGIVKRKKKEKKVTESAGDPKKGDRFQDKKGKKLTIVDVGSGQIAQAADRIEVKFDGEKYTRDIQMKTFFKPGSFKYIKENGCPEGTFWCKERKKCVNEEKSYVYVVKRGKEFKVPNDPKVIKKYKDKGFEIKESYVSQSILGKPFDQAGGNAGMKKKKLKNYKLFSDRTSKLAEKKANEYVKKNKIKKYKIKTESPGTVSLTIKESIYGATIDGQEIAGSGQTRAVGAYDQSVMNLKKPVRFNKLIGTFSPVEDTIEKIDRIIK